MVNNANKPPRIPKKPVLPKPGGSEDATKEIIDVWLINCSKWCIRLIEKFKRMGIMSKLTMPSDYAILIHEGHFPRLFQRDFDFAALEDRAKQGDGAACFLMSYLTEGFLASFLDMKLGNVVQPDLRKSFEWAQRGAKNGDILCIMKTALMLESGSGTPTITHKAQPLYSEALPDIINHAKNGSPFAITMLGVYRRQGHTFDTSFVDTMLSEVKFLMHAWELLGSGSDKPNEFAEIDGGQDPKNIESAKLYSLAAALGDPIAMANYSTLCADGEGVKRDLEVAFQWLDSSFAEGYIRALYCQGKIFQSMENYEMAFTKFLEASEFGDLQGKARAAQYAGGLFLVNRYPVLINHPQSTIRNGEKWHDELSQDSRITKKDKKDCATDSASCRKRLNRLVAGTAEYIREHRDDNTIKLWLHPEEVSFRMDQRRKPIIYAL